MALGPQEILIIALVFLVLFGASAIPRLARSLGRAQGEFQKARSELEGELKAGAAESAGPSEAQIRQTARELGIDEAGMELAAVKQAINEKLA
ncbi:MAG: twin-arginine translocase TatA/TatE family subunit [Thermoplasmatota archaeon]